MRKTTDLIYHNAVVNFHDGTNSRLLGVYIHPKNINEEGYIEEIWIIVDAEEVELNGNTYTVYSHLYEDSIHLGKAWIDHFDIVNNLPLLQLSDDLRVKYIESLNQ